MINLTNASYRNRLGFLIWALVYSLVLWFVPKPWNFDLGILLVASLFFIPEWSFGSFSFSVIKKESGAWAWNTIQFIAWTSVLVSGLITFLVTRAKAGVIDPYSFGVDWTLALIFGASALVFAEAHLRGLISKASAKQEDDATWFIGDAQFTLFTLLLLGFEAYSIGSILKFTTVPALLTNFPTPAFGIGLIYVVSALLKFILTQERK